MTSNAVLLQHPLLTPLDGQARQWVVDAARPRDLDPGEVLFDIDDPADAVFVIVSGRLELSAVRRGDETASVVGERLVGDTLGEEAGLDVPRLVKAIACEATTVLEVAGSVIRRAWARADQGMVEQQQRWIERRCVSIMLDKVALTRELPPSDLDLVVEQTVLVSVDAYEAVYEVGDRADAIWVVVSGSVQLHYPDPIDATQGRVMVGGYLGPGDALGDEAVTDGTYRMTAVALGRVRLLRVDRRAVRSVVDRWPQRGQTLRRVARERQEQQRSVVEQAAVNSTQHVFRDVYRMHMARSLLVIDQEACVRCGHCAWSCAAAHDDGVSRLVRRGDKLNARDGADMRSLLVPSSCQHCRNPACMVDCPTGAIRRDAAGEVLITETLCTGCGRCAKACPWDNIRLATQRDGHDVAVKCDLCHDHGGPACVHACPTNAISRVDPQRDFTDFAAWMNTKAEPKERSSSINGKVVVVAAMTFGPAAGLLATIVHERGWVVPFDGLGRWAGMLGALLMVALIAYTVSKRWPWVSRVLGRVPPLWPARSKIPWMPVHTGLGAGLMVALGLHAGVRLDGSALGGLWVLLALAVMTGWWGTVAYTQIPARLVGWERRGTLPEDRVQERDVLLSRLYEQLSGRSPIIKRAVRRHVSPTLLDGVRLVWMKHDLKAERAWLRSVMQREIEAGWSDGEPALTELLDTMVDLRVLPARRWAMVLLRAWLPIHIMTSTGAAALMVVHIAGGL